MILITRKKRKVTLFLATQIELHYGIFLETIVFIIKIMLF